MPKVSVVMPAYNAEKYIKEAIESILNQTFQDFELIIIDDGSRDNTVKIIESISDKRICLYKNPENLGVAATLNRGLVFAKGTYIARMDSDDISEPERFEKQVSFLDAHPEVGVCGTCLKIFGENLETRSFNYSQNDSQIRIDMIFNCAFAHPSVMMRNSVLIEHNLKYNVDYEKAEDYNLWFNMLKYCNGYNINEELLNYRYHKSQVTKTHFTQADSSLMKIRKDIYNELNIGSEKYLDIFIRVCNGERNFNASDYELFYDFVKIMLEQNKLFDPKLLKRTWSGINSAIYKECKPKGFKKISLFDSYLIVKDKLKNL